MAIMLVYKTISGGNTKNDRITYQDVYYKEEELNQKINEVIAKRLSLKKDEGEAILYKNILKKTEIDSTLDIEVFVTALKILSH